MATSTFNLMRTQITVPWSVCLNRPTITGMKELFWPWKEAVEEIIRYADSVDADVIVMATHGRSGISHVLMGSTAEQVIRKASCPVLTLKQPMLVTPRLRSDPSD